MISTAVAAAGNRCLHFDKDGRQCKKIAIQSHSLQRRGPLETIAESGHVTKIGPSLKARPSEDRLLFECIGVRKASTFPGFCEEHDRGIFEKIEQQNITLNEQTATILGIRSMAMELYRKHVMVQIYRELVEDLKLRNADQTLQNYKWIKRGAERAIKVNTRKLKKLFRDYYRGVSGNFHYTFFEFDRQVPFASTGAFEPAWDLDKNCLFECNPIRTHWNSVSLFCGNVGDNFYAVLSGYQKYRAHRIDTFLNSLDANSSDLISALFAISVVHLENCYVRSSWLETLSDNEISKISAMARSGILDGLGSPLPLSMRVRFPKAELISYRKI